MDVKLYRRGCASMEFLVGPRIRGHTARVRAEQDLIDAGQIDDALADELDARMDQVDTALDASRELHLSLFVNVWHGNTDQGP